MKKEDEKKVQEMIDEAMHSLDGRILHPSEFVLGLVKPRFIDGVIIQFGLAADRPVDGSSTKAWFAEDSGVLSLWNGTAWLTETFT